MPAKTKVFVPVDVEERTPDKNGYYEATRIDKGKTHRRIVYFHEKGFYWDETLEFLFTNVTQWLSEQEGYFFTPEQLKEVIGDAYNAGGDYFSVIESGHKTKRDGSPVFTEEEYINNLIK